MIVSDALRSYKQADNDGVMVIVSRQACDEAADMLDALEKSLADFRMMVIRLVDDAHRMHMIGPGYKDHDQAMLYAEAKKLIGR